MKSTKLGFFISAISAFCLIVSAQAAPSSPATPAMSQAIASADTALATAEQNLKRLQENYKAGVVPMSAVQDAQAALGEARIQSALAHQDWSGISDSLQQIMDARQAQLALAEQQYQAGVESYNSVLDAKTALVSSQMRDDLNKMVGLEEERLANAQRLFQVGAAAQAELDKAQADLKKAQDAFAAAQP